MRRTVSGQTAVITGASSGIGRELALVLDNIGFDTVLVARRQQRLKELSERLRNNSTIITADLSEMSECERVYESTRDMNVTLLVNCAGFGLVGDFDKLPLDKELSMIDLNVKALHVLTKLYLADFKEMNYGHILNVASSAGLMPGGPLMATYYATKAYVCSLTRSISQELRNEGSKVYVGALCPGPVDTEFNDVSGGAFAQKGISAKECALCAVSEMFRGNDLIIPGTVTKALYGASKLSPPRLTLNIVSKYQNTKLG